MRIARTMEQGHRPGHCLDEVTIRGQAMIRKLQSGEYRLYSRKGQSEDRQAPKSRHLQIARRGRKARAGRAIFQAALNPVVLIRHAVLCGAAIEREMRFFRCWTDSTRLNTA